MSALLEPDALTAAEVLAKMSAGDRAALIARVAREDLKDKSYLASPMGREIGRYLAAKKKELTTSSFIGYETCLHKLALKFADLALADLELPAGGDLIEQWMDERWGDAEPGTYNVNHSILRDFFRWQIRRQRMQSNPMDVVGRARKKEVYRTTFTKDQHRAIIASASELRDRIALRLLLDHGLRKGALQKIQFGHFDHQRKRLTVFTKGSKVRSVPLPEPALWMDLERLILDWEAEPEHYLMCLVKPIPKAGVRRFPQRPLSSTALHRWWYARLNDAGLVAKNTTGTQRTMNMHTARHTAGQRVLDATGDLKLTQKFLGHSSIQTTGDIYVDYDVAEVAQRIARILEDK